MTQEIAILIIAGALGLGLLVLAISLFSVAKAINKLFPAIEELKSVHHMTMEELVKSQGERTDIEKKRFEFEAKEKKPRVILVKSSNLKLFEEKQELSVGYSVENLGSGKVLVTKLQLAIVNKRSPNLIKIMDMIFNKVIDSNTPFINEVLITAQDFTRISLPFVPDFGFIKDSCQVVASLEYEDQYGERFRLDRDILEW